MSSGPHAAARWDRPWAGHDVVFVGYPLQSDRIVDTTRRTIVEFVKFVPEKSWRGALPDTITLFVDADAGCLTYLLGWRYIVTGNWDARVPGRLTTDGCSYTWHAGGQRMERLLTEEGPPTWVAATGWRPSLDSGAVRLGTPIPRSEGDGRIAYSMVDREGIVMFEIGDFTTRSRRDVLWMEPRLYQIRITFDDGSVFAGYLSFQCERRSPAPADCKRQHNFGGLRPSPGS